MLTLFRDRSTANLDVWSKLFVVGSLLVLGWFLAAPSLLELRLSNYEPKLRDIILWIQFVWRDSYMFVIWKRLWHIWSQTDMVPGHLVPHNWSLIDWSLWINGPQLILSPWTNGPQTFGPHGQMVPNQFGPTGQMVPMIFHLSRGDRLWGSRKTGTKLVGDHLSKGTKFLWTICPGGPNLIGTVCPGGSILWGSFVQGDRKSGDQIGRGPNASQS